MGKTDTKGGDLPPLIADILHDSQLYVDNYFADTWKRLRLGSLIRGAGFKKRSGTDIVTIVYLLLVWKWIHVSSINVFARKSLGLFSHALKDALYDTLKREDMNWRRLNLDVAKEVYDRHELEKSKTRVFILDDSIRARRGKKMEAVSSHFDHVSNTYVMGQQILTLGLATEESFLPVDSQIYISSSKAHPQVKPYQDGRSVGAKRYNEAANQTKVEMSAGMLARAVRSGIHANYVAADAWFGNKEMIRTALSLDMTAILRMKKNKLKYRVKLGRKWQHLNANELYQTAVRKQWRKVQDMPWKAVEMIVEVNLSTEKGKQAKPEYQSVKLLFVRGVNEEPDVDGSRKDWALFLSTDPQLATSTILTTYALRWGIEVYFKEAKQHLGFLKEQTITFVSHTASIHLCAIRYLMLVDGKLDRPNSSVGKMRADIQDQLNSLSFATQLWQIFRAIICGTLKTFTGQLGCTVKAIMITVDNKIEEFFVRSLQLDTFTMELEHEH